MDFSYRGDITYTIKIYHIGLYIYYCIYTIIYHIYVHQRRKPSTWGIFRGELPKLNMWS